MELSIIIVNWNTKKLVLRCIESILASKIGFGYEIVVVDNGSVDGSVEGLRKKQRETSKIKIIENRENLGFAKANNQGVRKARGKNLLLLNSDTEARSGAIERMVEFAKNEKTAGVVGARLVNKDGSVQPSCFKLPTLGRVIRQYWLGKRGLLDKYAPGGGGGGAVEVEAVVGASFLITERARKKAGLLDERYFMYYEDLDYCRRIRQAGLKVFYLAGAELIHAHGASGRGLGKTTEQWRRLIPSSKIYHGRITHYLIWFVMWSGIKLFR